MAGGVHLCAIDAAPYDDDDVDHGKIDILIGKQKSIKCIVLGFKKSIRNLFNRITIYRLIVL